MRSARGIFATLLVLTVLPASAAATATPGAVRAEAGAVPADVSGIGLPDHLPGDCVTIEPVVPGGVPGSGGDFSVFTCTYAETPPAAGLAGNSEGMTSNQQLNVHVPNGRTEAELGSLPVIVFAHGGGYIGGGKDDRPGAPGETEAPFIARNLVDRAVVVTINYTLRDGSCGLPMPPFQRPCNRIDMQDEGEDTFDTEMQWVRDGADAVAWVHETLTGGLGLGSAERVVLMGHSAGAHLVTLLATDPRWLQASFADRGLPPFGETREVIAGVVSTGAPMHLNIAGDGAGDDLSGDLAPQRAIVDRRLPSLSFGHLLQSVFALESAGPTEGAPALWQEISPLWQYQRHGSIPPTLLATGGGGCRIEQLLAFCNAAFPEPPLFAQSNRALARAAATRGDHVAFVQPLLRTQIETRFLGIFPLGTFECAAHVGHEDEWRLLGDDPDGSPATAAISPGMTATETRHPGQLLATCDHAAWRRLRTENPELRAVFEAFVEDVRAGNRIENAEGRIWWPGDSDVTTQSWSSGLSLPDRAR